MKVSKSVIIGLAVILLIVIGYTLYLHQGPIKRISNENEKLVAEISQLKTTSENLNAMYKAGLDEKTRLAEELERKTAELEKVVSRISKETETLETDLRATIKSLENQLAQGDRELQTSRAEVEKLRGTITRKSEDLDRVLLDSKNQIEGLHQELSTKDNELAKATQENQTMKNRMEAVAEERDRLRQTAVEFENQLAECRSRFQAISDDLIAKDLRMADMEKDHQSLLSKVKRQEKEKEELQRLRNALKDQLGMTQSQIEALSKEAGSKEEQLKSMEKALQELSRRFERQIREKEIQINTLEDKLSIRLLDKILFASGSADISSVGRRVLESLATELKKMDGFEIAVAGHTDNKPIGPKLKEVYDDNLGLSVARAAAVSRALREMGVSPENLSAVGYSMHRPVASNDTKEGRQENRRVEIILAPLR